MKKFVIVCIALVLGIYGASIAEAAVHVSMLSTGNEAAWVKCIYDTTPAGDGQYHYNYTIYLTDFDNYALPSGYSYYTKLWALKVMNYSGSAVEKVSAPTGPSDAATWNFAQDPSYNYYNWIAMLNGSTFDYIYSGEVLNSMEVRSPKSPGLVDAALWNGGTPTSSGKTMGPGLPEPGSMMLLGLGLLGFAGRMRRKFMA